MEDILKNATTGLFTDYMDRKDIPYDFLGSFDVNDASTFILGPVRTIECESGPFDDENIVTGLGYLDKCAPGDILIVEGSYDFAYFGELMSRLSKKRQLQGAVISGKTRDARFTPDHLPVFSKGFSPVDIKGRGRVKTVGQPIQIAGHVIDETMYAAADKDGVIVFNRTFLHQMLADLSAEIVHEEKLKALIEKGATVPQILEVTQGF